MTTARLGDALDKAAVLQRLSDDGLLVLKRAAPKGSPLSLPAWEEFREVAQAVLAQELNDLIRRNWPAPTPPSHATVVIAIRTFLLDPDATPTDVEAPSWLVLVPFHAAAGATAAKLAADEVELDCSRTRISFEPGGDRIDLTVRSSAELFVERCELVAGSSAIWRAHITRVVRRAQRTRLPLVTLSANGVRGLAPSEAGPAVGSVHVFVKGRTAPFTALFPAADLPAFERAADLFLDLGSTTTKWALRVDGNDIVEQDQDTLSLTESWGVDLYKKADFIADASGERWSAWIARALPALRRWLGREHRAYLRHVHLSLPTTERFDVKRLGEEVRAADQQDLVGAGAALHSAIAENLVAEGRVFLFPEHELVAAHYLKVLCILQKAALVHATRFKSHEDRRRDQTLRKENWEARKNAVDAFAERSWWHRLWNDKPAAPVGDKPRVDAKIADPAKWMEDLLVHPEQFDHVVLLDAGGLSLDVSVLERHELLTSLSRSDASCGGEAISERIGRNERGAPGTRHKARLGLVWRDARDGTDPAQREYREVTRTLYKGTLALLFEALGQRWTQARHCSVLLTGGGSRNPHLGDLVIELASNARLVANVVDAPLVQDLIRQARAFPEPLTDLASAVVTQFEAAQSWSERRERQPMARYDKFAVVGGMCALDSGLQK